MTTHFPDSTPKQGVAAPFHAKKCDWRVAAGAVTFNRIEWAINTFSSHKIPGMDGLFLALLQQGWRIVTLYLVKIFCVCLAMGYVPAIWRQVKVEFIPKPGRNSYTVPRDFRPISLTLFLFKTMERFVDRCLMDGALVLKPLRPNQHVYQAGKSVETALHQLILWVEMALDQWELTMGAFLDIEGAYNYTFFESMCTALGGCGVNPTTLRWINATLEGCLATATLSDVSMRVAVSRGCLQGGVLSPLLWCLVVDDLIARLSMGVIYCQGNVDDICLLGLAKFPNTAFKIMQRALHTVETQCGKVGLSVNRDKTDLVVFTKKRKLLHFFEPLFLELLCTILSWSRIWG
jgi:hypothetical protein